MHARRKQRCRSLLSCLVEYLKGIAGLVHSNEGVLERLQAGSRRHVARVVATINVQQGVVTLLYILDQLLHLIGEGRKRVNKSTRSKPNGHNMVLEKRDVVRRPSPAD